MPHTRTVRADDLSAIVEFSGLLSIQSLDLRAEYEAKLRILTEIQRDIESLRSANATAARRQRALEQLDKRFGALTAANIDASETLTMIRGEFDRVRRKANQQQQRERRREKIAAPVT
jgi:hypothetical protein